MNANTQSQGSASPTGLALHHSGEEMSMGYREISIKPAHGGFGAYDCAPWDSSEIWDDLNDLLDAAISNVGDVYELGMDALPPPIKDIRGRIHCEPPHIYAYLDAEGTAHYFGIDEA